MTLLVGGYCSVKSEVDEPDDAENRSEQKCTHSDGQNVLWIGVPLPWGGYKSEIAWTRSGTLVLGARPQGRAQARGRFSLVTLLQRAHPHVSSESFDVLGFVFAIMLWILASRSPHIRVTREANRHTSQSHTSNDRHRRQGSKTAHDAQISAISTV